MPAIPGSRPKAELARGHTAADSEAQATRYKLGEGLISSPDVHGFRPSWWHPGVGGRVVEFGRDMGHREVLIRPVGDLTLC